MTRVMTIEELEGFHRAAFGTRCGGFMLIPR